MFLFSNIAASIASIIPLAQCFIFLFFRHNFCFFQVNMNFVENRQNIFRALFRLSESCTDREPVKGADAVEFFTRIFYMYFDGPEVHQITRENIDKDEIECVNNCFYFGIHYVFTNPEYFFTTSTYRQMLSGISYCRMRMAPVFVDVMHEGEMKDDLSTNWLPHYASMEGVIRNELCYIFSKHASEEELAMTGPQEHPWW
ncbi:hypothetical protein PFISCL1PPCAC_4597, partial [Pristionchus fissidentatus]